LLERFLKAPLCTQLLRLPSHVQLVIIGNAVKPVPSTLRATVDSDVKSIAKVCPGIRSAAPFQRFPSLTSLDLSGCRDLFAASRQDEALEVLAGLTSLKCLNLNKCISLTSVAGLSGLTHLGVRGCMRLSALGVGLTTLRSLNVSGCTQLSSLAALTALTWLDASSCTVELLATLHGLRGLQDLAMPYLPHGNKTSLMPFITQPFRDILWAPPCCSASTIIRVPLFHTRSNNNTSVVDDLQYQKNAFCNTHISIQDVASITQYASKNDANKSATGSGTSSLAALMITNVVM
jgi:hypothetical protein